MRNLDEIDGVIVSWCATQTFASLTTALSQHEVPFSKIYGIDDVLADPHFQARGAIIRLPDPDLGSVSAPCVVPRFSGTPNPVPRSGPGVGEHNGEVFAALGLGDADLL